MVNANRAASALDENARLTETQGAYDAVAALRQSRLQQGADFTAVAASGTGLGGSVSDLLEANAVERQMEALNIRYGASRKADAYRLEASQQRINGQQALFGGFLRAGTSALTGLDRQKQQGRIADAVARDGTSRTGGAPRAAPLAAIPLPPVSFELLGNPGPRRF